MIEYYTNFTIEQMNSNEKQVKNYKIYNNTLQVSILIITPLVAFLNLLDISKLFPALLALIDTILVSLAGYFKFKEQQHSLQETNQKLLDEYTYFINLRGPYIGFSNNERGKALDHFIDRITQIKSEGFQNRLALEKTIQSPSSQTIISHPTPPKTP